MGRLGCVSCGSRRRDPEGCGAHARTERWATAERTGACDGAAFNRRNRSDGIGFLQQQSVTQRILGRKAWLSLPRDIESSHILIMGDSGTGKSTLIRQILLQIEERGETAIVYDPAPRNTRRSSYSRRVAT